MRHCQIEVELKFLVPPAARAAVIRQLERGAAAPVRMALAAMYLDTPDRRLARAGMAWRLRREGRRWIQTLKTQGSNPLERFEHEVARPEASSDPCVHASTPAGDGVLELLEQALAEGAQPGVRFQTIVRRTIRRVRTRGAVVEIAYDEGRLQAGEASQPIREIELELVSGSALAMLGLAERGDRLADGQAFAPLRKSARPDYGPDATAVEAFAAVLDECLAQVSRNAIGRIDGEVEQRVEQVHQLGVGIRRLRSALRSFQGWVATQAFDELDDAGLHALRKRIKRRRYAVEFYAPLLRSKKVERYLEALEALQDRSLVHRHGRARIAELLSSAVTTMSVD